MRFFPVRGVPVNKESYLSISKKEWKDSQEYELAHWKLQLKEIGSPKLKLLKFSTQEEVQKSLEDYCKGKTVVDIGSGPLGGLLTILNYRLGVSIDPLAKRYEKIGWVKERSPNHIYIEASVEDIPLLDNFADCVCTKNALDHGQNTIKAMQEMVRILKTGGRLYINVDFRSPSQRVKGHRICLNEDFFHDEVEKYSLKIIHEHIEILKEKGKIPTYIGIFQKSPM